MPMELKDIVVNLKSLSQDIEDPIIQGGGDANGRTFRLIFTQEAADMFTPETKVYLKWFHQQLKVSGLNVFKQVQSGCDCFNSPIWEIHWPQAMLHEGDVLCCIELIDDISIAPSNNFIVHVLHDPNDGTNFVVSDDYSVFKQACIEMNAATEEAKKQLQEQQKQFDDMMNQFGDLRQDVADALSKANEAYDMAADALQQIEQKDTATGLYLTEY